MEITINELIEKDKTFSESAFKSKVENQFMQIFLAITVGKIERIDHFVNDEVYARLKAIVEDNAAKNVIHFYEEPNVSNINICRIIEEDDSFTIEANVLFKAYDYFASKGDLKFISGNKEYRTETVRRIFFKKMKSARIITAALNSSLRMTFPNDAVAQAIKAIKNNCRFLQSQFYQYYPI